VINLLPSEEEPPLLRTRIKDFQVGGEPYVIHAVSQILSLPEVRRSVASLHLSGGFQRLQGIRSMGTQKRFNVHCQDVTLRQALNAIVRAQGRAVWSYAERYCNGRRTFTLEVPVE
jgi:hypothetical protein